MRNAASTFTRISARRAAGQNGREIARIVPVSGQETVDQLEVLHQVTGAEEVGTHP
jgi:hypothetical protein